MTIFRQIGMLYPQNIIFYRFCNGWFYSNITKKPKIIFLHECILSMFCVGQKEKTVGRHPLNYDRVTANL